jgi:formylglycine-generating enzyme required for sulfatase activity
MKTATRLLLAGSLGVVMALTGTGVGPGSARAVTIDTVPVGNAGNAADTQIMSDGTTGYGSVAYNYRIGTTEVTNAQYADFLNAVADTDTYGLYNTSMGSDTVGGITRTGSSGSYSYSVKADAGSYTYADKPVVYVSWHDSLRFANWLHNGQPAGAQDASTTEDGAYTFSGATSVGGRNSGAIWFLTSEDEWYKAAHYNGGSYYDYPTGTDTTPDNNLPSSDSGNSANFLLDGSNTTGDTNYPLTDAGAYALSASPYGTFDQGGNVWEWNEALISGSFRGIRGSSWSSPAYAMQSSLRDGPGPTVETLNLGFRVATVPEPSTLALIALGGTLFGLGAILRPRAGQNPLFSFRHSKSPVNMESFVVLRESTDPSSGDVGCPRATSSPISSCASAAATPKRPTSSSDSTNQPSASPSARACPTPGSGANSIPWTSARVCWPASSFTPRPAPTTCTSRRNWSLY